MTGTGTNRPARLVSIGLLLVLLISVLAPATSALAQAGSLAAINTGKLNVRTGPGIIFAIVTKLDYNTTVTLLGRADKGTWVQIQAPGGTQGWVNSIFLRTYADLSLLPITYVTPDVPPPPQTVPPPGSGNVGTIYYTVRQGDTLANIASRYRTTVAALMAANNILNANFIYAGQRLIISYGTTPSQPPPGTGSRYHTVRAGETLKTIAALYGTTWEAIASANNLANANLIYAGQRLVIPSAPPAPRYYTVQRGDTLFNIALRFGRTVQVLTTANNLANPNAIYAGQTLLIP